MATVQLSPGSVQCQPDWWPEFDAAAPSDAGCTLLDWVQAQRLYYGHLCEAGDADMEFVVEALTGLWCAIEMHRPRTVADLLKTRHTLVRGLDLAGVQVPRGRVTIIAAICDEEAQRFLAMDTDLGRLCAHAIIRQADEAEQLRVQTFDDYLAAIEAKNRAWEEAAEEPDYGPFSAM